MHPNEALLRKGFKAFGEADMETLDGLFADDIVWHATGNNPLSGDRKGKGEVFANFAQTAELSGGTFSIDLHDVVANDTHAIAIFTASAKRNGKSLESRTVQVTHVEGGKVSESWLVFEDPATNDAFWS